MIGQRFHQSLLFADAPPPEVKMRRGRNPDIIERRNERLAHRYYYKTRIVKIRHWDTIVEELATEFDLHEITVSKTITTAISDLVKDIFTRQPSVSELKRKYPYMSW